MAQRDSQRESPGGAVPLSNALFRHEVQSNKAASDKHKRNGGLTFNQEVMGSNPIALTKGTTQAKKTYDKIDAATTEAGDLIKHSYSKPIQGMQDYNNKILELAHANTNAAFDFVQKLSDVKSPTAFVELWTEHARKQVETLTEQSKQLAALGQKVTRATAEPLKTGLSNPFNIAA
jgi:phasin